MDRSNTRITAGPPGPARARDLPVWILAAMLAACGSDGSADTDTGTDTDTDIDSTGGNTDADGFMVRGTITPAATGSDTTVRLGSAAVLADSNGGFTFLGVARGDYTVTPSKPGVVFVPASRQITIATGGVSGVDFTATPVGTGAVTLAGAVTAAAGQVVDSDTADPNASPIANDTFAQAQAVPSAVTVGGHVQAGSDVNDVLRGSFAAGQALTLTISDATSADLDLLLFSASDLTTPVASSLGVDAVEEVSVPAGGEYYVVVFVAEGSASNYVLTAGTAATGAAPRPSPLDLAADFVPGQIVVRFDEAALAPADARTTSLPARAAALGLLPLAGAMRERPALLGLGDGAPARAQALATLGASTHVPPLLAAAAARDPRLAEKLDTIYAIKALRRRRDIRFAELNHVARALAVPNDRLYSYQWHYPLINLPQAWDITTGTPASGGPVIVAVLDTGVYLAHPDMTGQLVPGYDFVSNRSTARDGNGIDDDPDDPGDEATAGASSWHGSHVAGTVAARTNDGYGGAGVSWGARIMPVRVLGVGGGSSYDIIQGVLFAAGLANDSGTVPQRRADVANLSLGCAGCSSQAAQEAYTRARQAGVIVVAAAGNDNKSDAFFPASYAGVISVSAVDDARNKAPYSNFGVNVDVAAPGGNTSVDRDGNGYADGVLSMVADDTNGTRAPAFVFYQGTSMASPHLAGVIALMKAVCTTLTPQQVDTLIASGAVTTDLGAAGRDDTYGHGLIDALAAVRAAQQQCGAAPSTGLEVTPTRVDLGAAGTTATLTASKVGTGALTLSPPTDDAAWLTVTAAGVDAANLGQYTVRVDRSGLPTGRYAATITFQASGVTPVRISVSMQVGSPVEVADTGYLYVLLLDATTGTTVKQTSGRVTNGRLPHDFLDVPAGEYLLIAGTDSDNDDFVCDDGEACGAWPTRGAPTRLTVAGQDRSGLDFSAGFESTLSSSATGAPASAPIPQGGVRLLPREKRIPRRVP